MSEYAYELTLEPFEVMQARRELEAALADSVRIETTDPESLAFKEGR